MGSGRYTEYQSGLWAQGSYSLGSVVLAESASASETLTLEQWESREQSLSGTFTTSGDSVLSSGGGFGVSTEAAQEVRGTLAQASLDSLSLLSTGSVSYSLYEAGSSLGGCLSLGSVLFQAAEEGSHSLTYRSTATWTGVGSISTSGQETVTSGGNTGTSHTADISSFSYTLTASSAVEAEGEYQASDFAAGVYAGGSFAFGSVVHQESGSAAESFSAATTYQAVGR